MTPDTKFKKGDWVRVTKGFYKGTEGEVWSHTPAWPEINIKDRYSIRPSYDTIEQDCLELAEKPLPWWRRIFK